MTDIIKELEERGYIEQLTHEKEMRELFQKESVRFYTNHINGWWNSYYRRPIR